MHLSFNTTYAPVGGVLEILCQFLFSNASYPPEDQQLEPENDGFGSDGLSSTPETHPLEILRIPAVHLPDPRWAKFPFWHPFNMIFFHKLGPGSSKKAEIRVELQLQHEAHSSAFL